jgi:translation initiation factor 6 (eIF-6)
MTDQENFNKAWNNYTFVPDDPRERLKSVVNDRLGVDIMYTQARRILESSYQKTNEDLVDWDFVKKDMSELVDDEVVAIYHAFVKKYKGE